MADDTQIAAPDSSNSFRTGIGGSPPPSSVSDDTVNAFSALDEGKQRDVLGKMSPDAKQALLSGLKTRQALTATPAPPQDNSQVTNFEKQNAPQSFYQKLTAPVDPAANEFAEKHPIAGPIAKGLSAVGGMVLGMPEGAVQTLRHPIDTATSMVTGPIKSLAAWTDPVTWRGAASVLPEAIGMGTFNVLAGMVGAGGKTSTAKQVSKLTGAIGKTGETAENLRPIVSELGETAKAIDPATGKVIGKPKTVQDLDNLVQKTLDRHEAEFNNLSAPLKNQLVDVSAIRQKILNLVKADSSPEEIAYIKQAADEYLQPKTMEWLNARRGRLNSSTASLWSKAPGDVATAVKNDAQLAIDKAARSGVADLQYDVLKRTYGNRVDFKALKSRESNLIRIKDQLSKRIGDLTDEQEAAAGRTFSEKYNIRAYIGKHIGAYASGKSTTPKPLNLANKKVAQAFGNTLPQKVVPPAVRNAAVMTLPVTALNVRSGGLTPPPVPDEQQ